MKSLIQKKKLLQKYWFVPFMVCWVFLIYTIPVLADYYDGYNWFDVGNISFNLYQIGQTTYGIMYVGGVLHPSEATQPTQTILPIIAVVLVILYALKSLASAEGFMGILRTLLMIVFGSALVVVIAQTLNALNLW
jgi:hypothetical protein